MGHIESLGRMGLGSRLKKISDKMFSEVNEFYQSLGISLDASCFPILSLLNRNGPLSIREIQDCMGTSHPYISQKIKVLEKDGLIIIEINPDDCRSKIIRLSEDGGKLIEQAMPYWKALDRAIAKILDKDERAFFTQLKKLENSLQDNSVKDMALKELHEDVSQKRIEIVEYTSDLQEEFKSLNLEWLEKNFELNDFDLKAFENPQKSIIDEGGNVFFVMINDKVCGTAALFPDEEGFELCKMSVDPCSRGLGVGKILIEEAQKRAKEKGAEKLSLTSNKKLLAPAVRLYSKFGFKEVMLRPQDIKKYGHERIDIRMEKKI